MSCVWRRYCALYSMNIPVGADCERPPIVITIEDPDQPDVYALLTASDAYMAGLYPTESNHMVDVHELSRPDVTFIVARSGASVLGCGAIVEGPDSSAEIKRMFVVPAARGLKIGRRLLQQLETVAIAKGVQSLRLETGIKQPEALALYRSAGFVEIGPFGIYQPDPLSVFMQKEI